MPEGRVRPWGTCHAVMATRELLDEPFAVINSDDHYGADAFVKVYDFLAGNDDENTFCMVGYGVENTLSDQGTVTRGICTVEDGYLMGIDETKGVGRSAEGVITDAEGRVIPEGTVVSMNFWGFTGKMMDEMIAGFPAFLDSAMKKDPMEAEYLLPVEVGRMLGENKCRVRVLESADKWYGITYRDDKEAVMDAFRKMKSEGRYPQKLWG